MSILGYSASYFLPEYWSNTPLYGEKIVPLLDYILSTDFVQSDKLANAFYMMENKYKNTANLPISAIEAIIDESGYSYVKDLLGNNEESMRLLVYLLVLIHQLKGTKLGIEVVLNLLKRDTKGLTRIIVGTPTISSANIASNFSVNNYITYSGFTTDSEPFELKFQIRTGENFIGEQCIASCGAYGFYLGINSNGQLVLSLGSGARTSWDIANRILSSSNLLINTNYYIKLIYDGYNYLLQVSTDDKKYINYITVNSVTPTDIHGSIIYVGVDNSTGIIESPFLGYISLGTFSVEVKNVTITEWFEKFPVGTEDTFSVDADLDLGVVSSDFFEKFGVFVSKYVYPTLEALEAKLNFENNLTFLPYVRQRVSYVAVGDVLRREAFLVKEFESSSTATLPVTVMGSHGRLSFEVVAEDQS